jgi:hypothetical protein
MEEVGAAASHRGHPHGYRKIDGERTVIVRVSMRIWPPA